MTIIHRSATFAPASADLAARTIEVVFATETPVRRRSYADGAFDEVLVVAPEAVDLSRLNAGAAVLDTHADFSLGDVIGSVVPGSARIEGKTAVAIVRLSDRPEVAGITADILAGTIRSVSVGYRIDASERAEAAAGGVAVVRATRWTPLEISFVPVQADPNARTRSLPHEEDTAMPQTPTTSQAETQNRRAAFGDAERRSLAAVAGLGDAFATSNAALDEASYRSAVLDHMIASGGPAVSSNVRVEVGNEGAPNEIARAVESALLARMTGAAPEGRAREFAGMSILQLGEQVLQARGERTNWLSRTAIADKVFARSGGQHTTSDFPALLTSAGRRVLLDAYAAAESPLKAIARKRTAQDFRAVSTVRLSEAPALLPVNENGEVTHGSRSEAKEAFSLKTFGRIFGISRQALINDDLDAFADSVRAFGVAAANVEADQLAALLLANSGAGVTLDDGSAVFTTARGNAAASGAALDVTNVGAARQALRDTKGLDGKTPLNLAPAYLVVGSENETAGEQLIAQITPATSGDVNPFGGKLELLVDPRLNGRGWRVFASPAQAEVLSYAYLSGAEGVQVEQREGWETLGLEIRAVLDFGAGATGWRGAYWTPAS